MDLFLSAAGGVPGTRLGDCAELIRLYHQLGYIELAGELAIEYLIAVMGQSTLGWREGSVLPASQPGCLGLCWTDFSWN